MRAVVHDRYGPPEVLRLDEVECPAPKEDEVLVRVHATTVTRSDCGSRKPHPFFSRAFTGLRRPKYRTLGMEFAGEVEEVGAAVQEFTAGDRVFGVTSYGANAEYVCIRESRGLAHMPAGFTFEEAAAGVEEAASRSNAYAGPATSMGNASLSTAPPAPSGRRPSSSRNTPART